jgi:putative phosphoesterase
MIGVVSNSDGRADVLAAAMELFVSSGVQFVVHCGDVGGRHVLDVLSRLQSGFVWGDRDSDRMGLLRYAQSQGVTCFGSMGEFDAGDKRVVVVHGDDKKVITRLLDEQQYDYILCGHGLAPEDRTVGRTRVLNPGPLYGAGSARSAVLLDAQAGKLRLVPL